MTVAEYTVAKKKPSNDTENPPTRDRLDMRVDPEWMARVVRQADRLGISAAAYIRMATTLKLEQDEASDPR